MQAIRFKVVRITAATETVDVELQAKVHPVFTSPIYLHLPAGELSKFSIGQIYSLTGAKGVEVIETVPLGVRRHDPDHWIDGSSIQDDYDDLTAQDREQRGYRPPALLGIPGESLALGGPDPTELELDSILQRRVNGGLE